MPEEFDFDYLVHKVAESPSEEDYVWHNWMYSRAVLKMMLKMYDGYVEHESYEQMKNGN